MSDLVFPSRPEELTATLVTEALNVRRPGVIVERVDVASIKRCGEGVASTADRMSLDLTYATGHDFGLPSRMVLKTMLVSPRAPAEMFATEVRFYNEIRPSLTLETPQCFAATFDPTSGQFGLLLEDLNLRGARFPNATQDVSVMEVAALLQQLAGLHGRFWQSPELSGDLAWVATPFSGGMSGIFERYGLALIRHQVTKHPFKAELIAPLGLDLDQLWSALSSAQRILATSPSTLLHGDSHLGNTYLLPDGSGGLLDWQLQVRGCWAHDVVYLLSTALPPAVRRAEARGLLRGYLDALVAAGARNVPDLDGAWELCRRAVLWGLVIGWLITPPENYGREITFANTERMVQAVRDLDALAAIADGEPSPPHGTSNG
jgi:Phosphotransferase enzyme family